MLDKKSRVWYKGGMKARGRQSFLPEKAGKPKAFKSSRASLLKDGGVRCSTN